jgi:hypothetical protein
MMFAIHVTGIPMLALGAVSGACLNGLMTSVCSEAGYEVGGGNHILQNGGKVELTAEDCIRVVEVWQDLQIDESDAMEIFASLKHCGLSGADWEFHVFPEKQELEEIKEARTMAVHYSDDLDDQMDTLNKQMEALHNKQRAALRSCARLDQMVRDRSPSK